MHDHGGSHYHKVTKETLLCIIVLVLDFPTLSAPSIAKYLNSKYGPNYPMIIKYRLERCNAICLSLNSELKKHHFHLLPEIILA